MEEVVLIKQVPTSRDRYNQGCTTLILIIWNFSPKEIHFAERNLPNWTNKYDSKCRRRDKRKPRIRIQCVCVWHRRASYSFQLLVRHCPLKYKGLIIIILARRIWKCGAKSHIAANSADWLTLGWLAGWLCRLIFTTLSVPNPLSIPPPIRNADHVMVGALKDWFDDSRL